MAAARDQAARIIHSEPDVDESASVHAAPDEQRRAFAPEEPVARSTPSAPAIDKPAPDTPAAAATAAAAPKSGKRKFVLMGIVSLLALAAVGYGSYYTLVGRFYVSTDDAYVRANNTILGARVSGHIAAIVPGDNV